ncbi:protein lifeguard 3-like [Haliotis cracherodii]|uniref:protein lifeguard 3-like n=1 Tax=Haliotis cracherodii TaxID=6455 RepID=UPI0039EC5A51
MSAQPTPPPSYEQVLLESQGDANMEIFTVQNPRITDLDYNAYTADDQGPPPPRVAFVASSAQPSPSLPRKGTPPASPANIPALALQPVSPAPAPAPAPAPTAAAAAAAAAAAPAAAPVPKPKPKPKPDPSLKGFKCKEDRRTLIRKLYLLMAAMQLATVGSVSIFVFIMPIKHWMKKDGLPLLYASIGIFVWCFFVLAVILPSKKKVEGSSIRFVIFTISYAWLLGAVSGHFATYILLAAAVVIGLTFLAAAIISIKADINMKKGLIIVSVVVLFLVGLTCIGTYFAFGVDELRDCGFGGLIALVVSELMTACIQLMLSKNNHGFTKESPCLAFFHLFSYIRDVVIMCIHKILCCAL